MAEGSRYKFQADPAQARYGSAVHGAKQFVDGLARATGLSASAVIGVLVAAAGVSLAVVVGAAFIIARDTAPSRPEPVSDYVPGGPPPPDRAALNSEERGASPAPTDVLGDRGGAYGSDPGAEAPQGGAFDGSKGAGNIPLSSFLTGGMAERARELRGQDPAEAGTPPEPASGGPKAKPEPKPWKIVPRGFAPMESGFKGTTPSAQQSAARSEAQPPQAGGRQELPGGGAGMAPESMTKRRFATSAAERAGKYAKDLPSVPSVGEGRTLGAQQTDGAPAAGPEDETPAPRKKGKADGPVVQEKVPDVGPGKQVGSVPSGPGPSGRTRVGTSSGGDILSTPVDVNRIQVEANKANDVDKGPGVNVIGK